MRSHTLLQVIRKIRLFHPAIFHFHALLVILLALAGGRFGQRDANHGLRE